MFGTILAGWSAPEGRQIVAHGVSRGFRGMPATTSAPEGRQSHRRGTVLPPLPGLEGESRATLTPTADAVGYYLLPLRG